MKKNLLLAGTAFMLGLSSIACGGAYAIETSGIDTAADLKNCLTSASAICSLGGDIELDEPITVTGNVTLNLGDYKIEDTAEFVNAGWGMLTVSNGAKLTINGGKDGGIFASTAMLAIRMTSHQNYSELQAQTARLIVNGGTISGYSYGISGNGNRHNTSVVINGGTITATEEDDNVAIYQPQNGELVINDGVVTGTTGIAIKSGSLEINGGTIIGTGTDTTPVSGYSNGVNVSGAALQIESNTDYYGAMKISLTNANLVSEHSIALYEYVGKGTVASIDTLEIATATIKGDTDSIVISPSLAFQGKPTYVDGYGIVKNDSAEFVTKKLADVEGLANDENVLIAAVDSDDYDATQEDAIEELEEEGYSIDTVYEIDVRGPNGFISETSEPLSFSIDVPSEPAEGYTREWSLYYIHNRSLKENTTLKEENGKLTWDASEFSTYIFVYEDTAIPTTPNTGIATSETDSAVAGVSAAVAASAVACGAAYLVKRSLRR